MVFHVARKTQETTKIKSSTNSGYSVFVASGDFCEKIIIVTHYEWFTPSLSAVLAKAERLVSHSVPLNKNGECNAEKHPNGTPAPRHPVAVWLNFTRGRSEQQGQHRKGGTRAGDSVGGLADKNYSFKVEKEAL